MVFSKDLVQGQEQWVNVSEENRKDEKKTFSCMCKKIPSWIGLALDNSAPRACMQCLLRYVLHMLTSVCFRCQSQKHVNGF